MRTAKPPTTDTEFGQLLRVARLAAAAGAEQLMAWRGKFQTREKSPADLVTDADLASQQAISKVVHQHFPDHAFLGEENPGAVGELLAKEVCWIVDPLDGTTNYVHGFPAFSVSVAVTVKGQLAAGVIVDPLRSQEFSAAKGSGAWCNGEPITASSTQNLSDGLVAMSLPPQVNSKSPDLLDFAAVVPQCQAVRRLGSAALNLAYVAQGVLDAHWARVIMPWDVAAGVLLVQEAGGVVSASDGGPLDLANPHFVASATPNLHEELLAVLGESGVSR